MYARSISHPALYLPLSLLHHLSLHIHSISPFVYHKLFLCWKSSLPLNLKFGNQTTASWFDFTVMLWWILEFQCSLKIANLQKLWRILWYQMIASWERNRYWQLTQKQTSIKTIVVVVFNDVELTFSYFLCDSFIYEWLFCLHLQMFPFFHIVTCLCSFSIFVYLSFVVYSPYLDWNRWYYISMCWSWLSLYSLNQ